MGLDQNLILLSPTEANTFMKIDLKNHFKNLLETTSIHQKAGAAVSATEEVRSTKIKGLPDSVDPMGNQQIAGIHFDKLEGCWICMHLY
jgi:hypothetical protein